MTPHRREFRRVALGAIGLFLTGIACGLVLNWVHPLGHALGSNQPVCPPPKAKFTTLEAAAQAFEAGAALFVDARAAEAYAEGHIPGAISLPLIDFDEVFAHVRERLRAAPRIITYCSGADCRASEYLGDRLVEEGFEAVEILPEGFPAWEAAGYPVAVGEEP
ncbi:MAG: rhodanese-like domain-containing protein [Armatimonadota bacterium]